jgi:histidine triad (HIT) family protein
MGSRRGRPSTRLYPRAHGGWLRLLRDVAGTSPAEHVYEDASVVAIMDIHPAVTGHVLVIPKHHSPDLWHIEPADAAKAMAASVQVAGMIRQALAPDGINLVHATGRAAWQTVFHFHLHLVPRYDRDGLVPPWSLGQPRAEEARLRAVAEKIRSAGE